MNTCFPIKQWVGLDSVISDHFGKAPFHTVVNLQTLEAVAVIDKAQRAEGECAPIEWMQAQDVRLVLCKSLGRGAYQRLHELGVEVGKTQAKTVREALEDYRHLGHTGVKESDLCQGHTH